MRTWLPREGEPGSYLSRFSLRRRTEAATSIPPPQTELAIGPGGGQADEVAQGSFPDDLDQTPSFNPAEPEPIPDDDFDQSWGG